MWARQKKKTPKWIQKGAVISYGGNDNTKFLKSGKAIDGSFAETENKKKADSL